MWMLNVIIIFLVGVNVLAWGYCIKDVGLPVFSLEFLLKLTFNKFFITAMVTAFIAALLKYSVVQRMGVFRGTYFLLTSSIVVVLVSYFILGEKLTFLHCLGVVLVLSGVYILGT